MGNLGGADEKKRKAMVKVQELESKLGLKNRDLPDASAATIAHKYNVYAQKEREQKRARFPPVTNKEKAVKRVYEIMHKTKHLRVGYHAGADEEASHDKHAPGDEPKGGDDEY